MKLIKSLVCVFSLAITAILLAGCSAKADKLNEVAKEALKSFSEAKGLQVTVKSYSEEIEDGKKETKKISAKISINADGEMIYSIKSSGVENDKKFSIKEKGVIVKDGNVAKAYIDRKATIDGNKEDYKKVYTLLSTDYKHLVVDDAVDDAIDVYLFFVMYTKTAETVKDDELNKEEDGTTMKASSFLGSYKFTSETSAEYEGNKMTGKGAVKFNKKGIKSGKIESETTYSNGNKSIEKYSATYNYKNVKVKAPSGSYTESSIIE